VVVTVVTIVVVEVGRAAGARHIDDDALGLVGFGLGCGGLGVFLLALHDAEAVEDELGDVGHGGGLASGDAALGQLFQEVAEEEVDGGGRGEGFRAGEEFGCGGFAVLCLVGFGFGTRVIGAERGVIGSEEHVAATVEMGAELTLGVCGWFARHGLSLLSVWIEGI
jgi:hypothetical protein